MSIHIIIDGYNLIRQSNDLSYLDEQDIKLGRDALIDRLVQYKRLKSHRITVVFDGQNAPTISTRKSRFQGVDIRFSSLGESADTVIKNMAAIEKERALVVTSDREIESVALAHKANVISSPQFEAKLIMAQYAIQKGETEEDTEGWTPTTQKKGPRRKLSKRARNTRAKMRKL